MVALMVQLLDKRLLVRARKKSATPGVMGSSCCSKADAGEHG